MFVLPLNKVFKSNVKWLPCSDKPIQREYHPSKSTALETTGVVSRLVFSLTVFFTCTKSSLAKKNITTVVQQGKQLLRLQKRKVRFMKKLPYFSFD